MELNLGKHDPLGDKENMDPDGGRPKVVDGTGTRNLQIRPYASRESMRSSYNLARE